MNKEIDNEKIGFNLFLEIFNKSYYLSKLIYDFHIVEKLVYRGYVLSFHKLVNFNFCKKGLFLYVLTTGFLSYNIQLREILNPSL